MNDFTPDENNNTENDGIIAVVGNQCSKGTKPVLEQKVIEALQNVEDPEIMVNIYDMGLIYKIEILDNCDVNIDMTLTAPGCPVAGELPREAAEEVAALEGAGKVTMRLVWEPTWTPERMTEDARMMLNIF
jgi:FeS assembly SUF system protein